MRILRSVEIALVKDRNTLKWRINIKKDNFILGQLKPTNSSSSF